jgi:serine/threonine protein kinase
MAYAPAFSGTTGEIFKRITMGPAPSLQVSPDSDHRLDDIIRRAMALDPAQRYNDLDDMRTELAAVRASLNPASAMVSVSSPSKVMATAAPIADAEDLATLVLATAPERRRTWLSSQGALAIAALTKVVGAAIRVWKSHMPPRD